MNALYQSDPTVTVGLPFRCAEMARRVFGDAVTFPGIRITDHCDVDGNRCLLVVGRDGRLLCFSCVPNELITREFWRLVFKWRRHIDLSTVSAPVLRLIRVEDLGKGD